MLIENKNVLFFILNSVFLLEIVKIKECDFEKFKNVTILNVLLHINFKFFFY